jgi:hypothetical protein
MSRKSKHGLFMSALATSVAVLGGRPVEAAGTFGVESIAYSGSGCPEGSVTSTITPDGTTMSLSFSRFAVEVGPGIDRGERAKTCKLHVKLRVPKDVTYSLVSVDYRGYASLEDGVRADRASAYHFAGEPPEPVLRHPLSGPMDGDYAFRDEADSSGRLVSPCGKGKNLFITTVAKLDASASAAGFGVLTADTVDGVVDAYRLEWRRCS